MTESTPKRVLPARERRESFKLQASSPPMPLSSSPKKTTSTQIPVQTPTQTPDGETRIKRKYVRRAPLKSELRQSRNSSTPASEEALPTRVTSSKPLPTARKKPEYHISTREYQSIAESAILAASLHRSRLRWLCDGIFQRYWIKPSKRKGAQDVAPNNPDQKSMQRLGSCTITIEPHAFDAVVYTVRDPQGPPPPMPYARHPNQYPPKQQSPLVQQHPPFYPPSMVPVSVQNTPTNYTPTPPPSAHTQPPTQNKIKREKGANASPPVPGTTTPSSVPPPQIRGPPAPTPARKTSTPSTPAPKPNADPVIQMLASRAASDPRLKDLMKVVATSKATPAQLKEFQGHIDEFNAVIKRDQEAQRERELQGLQPATPAPQMPQQLDGSADARSTHNISTAAPVSALSAAHPAAYNSNYRSTHPQVMPLHAPPYGTYAPPLPRPESLVKHIVLELTSPATSTHPASQDRWLFPEYAVLDTPLSGRGLEMVCSFFVERKGSQITASHPFPAGEDTAVKWKADVEYYQPITMTVRASQHKTLETIARAARPLHRVHDYMVDIMKKKTRAPEEYLVLQLPGDEKGDSDVQMTDFADSAVEMSLDEDDELKDIYGV